MRGRDYQELLDFYKEQIIENQDNEYWKQQLTDLVKHQQEYDSNRQAQDHIEKLRQIELDVEVIKERIKKDDRYDQRSAILKLAERINIEPLVLVNQLRDVGSD